VATLDIERVSVEPHGEYPIVGVLNAGQGLFWRESIAGRDTTYKVLHRLKTGHLVYRKLTAWEGPITVVPPDFEGGFVSTEFPTFTLDESQILPEFMALLCQRPSFWREMRFRSTGTAERRNRLKPSELLAISIDLPPLAEQGRLVEVGRAVARAERELAALRAACAAAREHLLAAAPDDAPHEANRTEP